MRRILFCFALLMSSYLIGCQSDVDENVLSVADSARFTEEEALLLECLVLGTEVPEEEICEEALSVMDFSAETPTRVPRRIAEVVKFPSAMTRAAGLADDRMYVVNFADNAGFAIACSDRRADRIWAAVPYGNFDPAAEAVNPEEEMYGLFVDLMQRGCRRQIERRQREEQELIARLMEKLAAIEGENDLPATRVVIQNVEITDSEWEEMQKQPALVKTLWHQKNPFNDSLPKIQGVSPVVGCTGIAIAQMMAFHRRPLDFDWDAINASPRPETVKARSEVARLCRIVCENLDTQYGLSSSGAYLYPAKPFFQKLGYQNPGRVSMDNYDLDHIIENICEQQIPVAITGYEKSGGGHTWVIDGYMKRKRLKSITYSGSYVQMKHYEYQQLLHCNFGWSGNSNGYYNHEIFDPKNPVVADEGLAPVTMGIYEESFRVLYDVVGYRSNIKM